MGCAEAALPEFSKVRGCSWLLRALLIALAAVLAKFAVINTSVQHSDEYDSSDEGGEGADNEVSFVPLSMGCAEAALPLVLKVRGLQ
jgi:hypothetical protein